MIKINLINIRKKYQKKKKLKIIENWNILKNQNNGQNNNYNNNQKLNKEKLKEQMYYN